MAFDKFYPPIIEGTIPAFYGDTLKVPFVMNKSVNKNRVKGFYLKMKTVQSNYMFDPITSNIWDKENCIITFTLNNILNKLNVGQFYKIQIAYESDDNIIGHYSTVGVVKYTTEPTLTLESIDNNTFIGGYKQYLLDSQKNNIKDSSEKVYSYSFNLKNKNGDIIETSGEKLHNSSQDTSLYESYDFYTIKTELEKNVPYTLEYNIRTINNLIESKQLKNIVNNSSIDSVLKTIIHTNLDYENGGIDINLENEATVAGNFILLRSSDEDNFKTWNELLKFSLYGQNLNWYLLKDLTIKQGVNYKYAIQQYNSNGIRSNKIESDVVQADFEYAYLYDGQRQLKIKYNPKVSSFKNTLLESKIDTIGSKHPFIFRNGNVNYKEFPISGLISYLSDENSLFDLETIKDEKFREKTVTENTKIMNNNKTDLVSNNVFSERKFKLDVLDWLTNGEPKLFRSPTEGNYIVRLLNVSLTPMDQLGRMLHTFNCNAYEIAENNFFNLKFYNFIEANNSIDKQLRWESVEFSKIGYMNGENVLKHTPAAAIRLDGMVPGEKIQLSTIQGEEENNYSIIIGATGSYIIDLNNNIKIENLSFTGGPASISNEPARHQGMLTYAYYSDTFKGSFDSISKINFTKVPCHQFIGEYENIIDEIENIKDSIESIGFIRFTLRNAEEIVYSNGDGQYYSNEEKNNPIILEDLTDIYKVYYNDNEYTWYDGYNNKDLGKDYNPIYTKIYINGEEIDIVNTGFYEIKNPFKINSIQTGAAIITEICYQKKTIDYDLEETNNNIIFAKNKYLLKKQALNLLITKSGASNKKLNNTDINRKKLKEAQDACEEAYKNFVTVLEKAVEDAERR